VYRLFKTSQKGEKMDRKELTQEIAIKLLKLRKSHNYTTVDMAQKLGIKRGS
jgi:DNA-binding XRE family transcriptional regulator